MILRWFARIVLVGLLIFELLNYLNILHFELNFTWLGLITTLTVVLISLEIIHYFLSSCYHRPLHPAVWFAVAFALYFDALGDILHFYGQLVWYDQAAHFIGAAMAGIVIFSILQIMEECKKISTPTSHLLTFTIVTTLGVFYELEEYLEDYFTFSNRLGDGFDTVNDLLFNTLGVLTIILIAALIKKCIKK